MNRWDMAMILACAVGLSAFLFADNHGGLVLFAVSYGMYLGRTMK